MKKESYYCDKCKKKVKTKNDLRKITLGTGQYIDYVSSNYKRMLVIDICLTCCRKIGLIQKRTKIKAVVNPPDIKDRLFDIFVELIEELQIEAHYD